MIIQPNPWQKKEEEEEDVCLSVCRIVEILPKNPAFQASRCLAYDGQGRGSLAIIASVGVSPVQKEKEIDRVDYSIDQRICFQSNAFLFSLDVCFTSLYL